MVTILSFWLIDDANLEALEVFQDAECPDSHIVTCSMSGNLVKRSIYDLPREDETSLLHSLEKLDDPHLRLTRMYTFYQDKQERLKNESIALQEDVMSLLVKLAQVRCGLVHAGKEISSITMSMSPIQLLPGEILQAIFLEAVVGGSGDWPDMFASSPVRISQVCTDWRRIALQQPQLWTRFFYNMKWVTRDSSLAPGHSFRRTGALGPSTGQLSLLESWLQRSFPLPVAIFINIDESRPFSSGSDPSHNSYKDHRSLFRHHGSRIEHLRLSTNSTNAFAYLEIPNIVGLKRVELDLNRCEFHDAPINDFRELPHLANLTYSIRSGNAFLFPARWQSITHFDLGDSARAISILHWKYFVRCCPNLQRGRFNIGSRLGDADGVPFDVISSINPHTEFSLSKLKELTLLLGDSVSLSSLLENIHLPRLQELEIRAQGPLSDGTLASWHPVFQELGSSLRHLSVFCPYIRDLDLFKLSLERLVNLTSLKLKLQNDKMVLQMLTTYHSSDTSVLPNLQTLGIWISELSDSEKRCFWEMVKSRGLNSVDEVRTCSPFVVDVYVDKTKLYSDKVHATLWDGEYSQVHPCVRIHVKSPYASM